MDQPQESQHRTAPYRLERKLRLLGKKYLRQASSYGCSPREREYGPNGPMQFAIPLVIVNELIIAYSAYSEETQEYPMDSDSKELGIDNRCSAFISGDISDFKGELVDSNKVVRGYGGVRIRGAKKGTAIIKFEDDDGAIHKFRLPNSYFVPGTNDRLLSPQHFAQELKRQRQGQAEEHTDDEKCVLYWGNQFKRTVLLDPMTNVTTISKLSTVHGLLC
jgi:hypothetical protein